MDQFLNLGIRSIINLQTPGEHASCGPNLTPAGFTYDPADFMKANVFFYNFAWKDFGEVPMTSLLDMVKVCISGSGMTVIL